MAELILYGGSKSSVEQKTSWYAAHPTSSTATYQNYRAFYDVPLTSSNQTIPVLSFTTRVRVSNGGDPETVSIQARVYTTKDDAQALNDNYYGVSEKANLKITATAADNVLTFQFTGITSVNQGHVYIAFVITKRNNPKNLIEICNSTDTTFEYESSYSIQIYGADGSWKPHQVYIYKNNTEKWKPYTPYIYDGIQWVPYGTL